MENSLHPAEIIALIICFGLVLLVLLLYYFSNNKCIMGGKCEPSEISQKRIIGNEIGFGIKNGGLLITYKCKKCNEITEHYE